MTTRGGGRADSGRRPSPLVLGCGGSELSHEERAFFGRVDPLGFILFARNCLDPEQIRRLIGDLRDCVGRGDAPVLIDQEGGRVARLKPPHWRAAPPARRFADVAAGDPERALEAVRLNARLIADELFELGITVDCAPVLDVPQSNADPIIGDRAYGDTPDMVARLAEAACEGLLDGGVLPVVKHIPGHGRATVDSHLALPTVEATREELERIDVAPFRALRRMPWAMTAHVIYTAIDAEKPATLSTAVIGGLIRRDVGFDGLLISDDLSMQALSGSFAERSAGCLAAGCDIALHCNGQMAEMAEVAEAAAAMTEQAWRRYRAGEAMRRSPVPHDRRAAALRLAHLMA